jgi:hypothetical protein
MLVIQPGIHIPSPAMHASVSAAASPHALVETTCLRQKHRLAKGCVSSARNMTVCSSDFPVSSNQAPQGLQPFFPLPAYCVDTVMGRSHLISAKPPLKVWHRRVRRMWYDVA